MNCFHTNCFQNYKFKLWHMQYYTRKNDLVVYTSYKIEMIKDQNKRIMDFYLKEKILNENDKKIVGQ